MPRTAERNWKRQHRGRKQWDRPVLKPGKRRLCVRERTYTDSAAALRYRLAMSRRGWTARVIASEDHQTYTVRAFRWRWTTQRN